VYGDAFIMRWSVKFYVANFDVVGFVICLLTVVLRCC